MDGSSRDPNVSQDKTPCGAGGVHGWESLLWRVVVKGSALTEDARAPARQGLLQPPTPPLWPQLLDPGPGLRADGQGRVMHLTHPSTPTGQAQGEQHLSHKVRN